MPTDGDKKLFPVARVQSEDNDRDNIDAALQEHDDLRNDLYRKHQAAREPSFGTAMSSHAKIPLAADAKISLAIGISVASLPGAYRSEDNDKLVKPPSHAQLLEISRMRESQKSRLNCQQPDRGLEECQSDDLHAINDLHQRMNDFNDDAVVQTTIADVGAETRRKTKLSRLVLLFIIVLLLITGTAVGVTLGIKGAKTENDSTLAMPGTSQPTSPKSNINNGCNFLNSTSDEMTERFTTYRSIILANLPSMTASMDQNGSFYRSALCWISELDVFDLKANINIVQRFIMVLIYMKFNATGGSSGMGTVELSNHKWLTSIHECNWDLVDCTPTDEVTELSLSSLALTGQIPSEIALLTKLTRIDFRNNDLSAEIPSELWGMKQLESLLLSGNRLVGTISPDIAKLSELKHLLLGRNWLTGTIPDLTALSQLTRLVVADNLKINGEFPDISTLTKLAFFQFAYIGLKGTIPEYFWSFTNLRHLSFISTSLSGTIPAEIGNLGNLSIFSISSSDFSGTIPTEIGVLSNLESLTLDGNLKLSGTMPTELCALSILSVLQVSDAIPKCECCMKLTR